MKYCLYLDDIRNPKTDKNWIIVRSFEEFKNCLELYGTPEEMSLDHDLGEDVPSGMDCVKWYINEVLDNRLDLCLVNVHSANPVGAENIRSYIISYTQTFENQHKGMTTWET